MSMTFGVNLYNKYNVRRLYIWLFYYSFIFFFYFLLLKDLQLLISKRDS